MSSFVTAGVSSAGGKITRSPLLTRTSRPLASTYVSVEAIAAEDAMRGSDEVLSAGGLARRRRQRGHASRREQLGEVLEDDGRVGVDRGAPAAERREHRHRRARR